MVLKPLVLAHRLHQLKVSAIPQLIYGLNRILFSVAIPPGTQIGRGGTLSYQGIGTVIHARAIIGDRVYIGPGITIGSRSSLYEVPVKEDNVYIGAGARNLGPVRVGNGAVIGANAVVIHDVPARTVVGGIPVRILKTTKLP
jgi:serine O-acetyltransferase